MAPAVGIVILVVGPLFLLPVTCDVSFNLSFMHDYHPFIFSLIFITLSIQLYAEVSGIVGKW